MSVFKDSPRSHLHVRTPVMIAVVLFFVVVLSLLFYYMWAPTGPVARRPPTPVAPDGAPLAAATPCATPPVPAA